MYAHLSREQRLELAVLRREGFSLRSIGKRLGVSHSSLSRELSRNGSARAGDGYHAGDAQHQTARCKAATNGLRIRIKTGSALERRLVEKIGAAKWSPEQVSGWLSGHNQESVCPRTIYDWSMSEGGTCWPICTAAKADTAGPEPTGFAKSPGPRQPK